MAASDSTVSKVCRKCGALFIGIRCLACRKAREAQYYLNNKKTIDAKQAKYRSLNQTKVKACIAAWQSANQDRCKAKQAAYRATHKAYIKAYGKAWNVANPGRSNARTAIWAAANKGHRKSTNAAWRENNKLEINARNAARKAANPEPGRIYEQNRRARKRATGGVLSKGLAAKLLKLQKGKCACCGLPSGNQFHLDHIMPLALGGAHEDRNIQLLRQTCNNQKSAAHPIDWMQSRGFLI